MGYESELNDLFVDDELFSYAINDITNQHEINSSIRLGSILNRIKIDYGLQGIRQTVSFINKISATKVVFNDLRKTMKFFEYISKGMRISYKITMDHYKMLLKLNDTKEINDYIDICAANKFNVDDLSAMLNDKNKSWLVYIY